MKNIFFVVVMLLLGFDEGRAEHIKKKSPFLKQLTEMLDSNRHNTGVQLHGYYFNEEASERLHAGISGYHPEFTDSEAICGTVFFFGNNVVAMGIPGLFGEASMLTEVTKDRSLTTKYDGYFCWGAYSITGNTISALLYVDYETRIPHHNFGLTRFTGTIASDSIIVNWHSLAPYPIYSKRSPTPYAQPQALKYRTYRPKTKIDSNRAWINEFRSKQ